MAGVSAEHAEGIVEVGRRECTIAEVGAVSRRRMRVALPHTEEWRTRAGEGAAFLERLWRAETPVYGVTTGYGDSCSVRIPTELVESLPMWLVRFHGCGMGRVLDEESARAVLMVRLTSLARGVSGVRLELLEALTAMINSGAVPLIPEEGSVGASGDLTPLSYVAAALTGERLMLLDGEELPAGEALDRAGLEPVALRPKEALALMNGTSMMTALACLAWERAEYLLKAATRATALACEALGANRSPFDPRLHNVKPHPGQKLTAGWIASDIGSTKPPFGTASLQDRYSVRCAPHILGVLADALVWTKKTIEIELNSANDNPIILPEDEEILHGGHFYGGHIAFAMDALKAAVANVADLLDRQLALLVDKSANNGLPPNLTGAREERRAINHGYKAVQIATSAWAAEALKLTMPASAFSRSTECHNQDKVSMGSIASRDCIRVLELTEQTAAAGLLAGVQALELRERAGELPFESLSPSLMEFVEAMRDESPFLEEDRPLDDDLRRVSARLRERTWRLYE